MPAIKSVHCLIYDVDGLLLDTEQYYTEAAMVIARRYGKSFDWSLKARMIGKRALDSAKIFTEALGLPLSAEEYLKERKGLLDEMFPRAEPLPGARELTRHFHACGVPQALATSSDRRNFDLKTARHGEWFAIFDCLVAGDDPAVGRGKPAPDIFLVAAARLGTAPGDCLVFEDSPAGVEAAVAAGMPVIAVPDRALGNGACRGADQVLQSLCDFDPAAWGLPPWSRP